MSEASSPLNAAVVARQLAEQLQSRGHNYALGGAIALGYWGEPRGTVDVDVTLFLPPERSSECVWLLQDIGCEFSPVKAAESLREHGFCRVTFAGMDVDVFLPLDPCNRLGYARTIGLRRLTYPLERREAGYVAENPCDCWRLRGRSGLPADALPRGIRH
ncbi:MAG: hypothetical protein ACLP9L_37590 [Thermoguttaceae bacterium]